MALEKEKVHPLQETIKIQWRSILAGHMAMLPDDSSDPGNDSDSEVQSLTRTEALNSMNITEGIEMVKNLLQIMTSLDEAEASHMLTRVYHKLLDLKVEKKNLNSK